MPRKARRPDAPKVASGQAYGQRQAQEQVLSTIPSQGGGGGPLRGGSVDPAATLAAAQQFQPPPVTGMGEPSERPGEPVTAGLPIGAGPGPEVMGGMTGTEPALETLRAIYMQYPSETIRELIEDMEAEG